MQGTKSLENLKEAFSRDAQMNRRYVYFARKADTEGYVDVGGLLRDVAEAETAHAFGHLDFLKQVGDPVTNEPIGNTQTNLRSAIASQTFDYSEVYPGFARTAREEGLEELAEWFEMLARAERSHTARLQQALDSIS
jgi:rubrerythrin